MDHRIEVVKGNITTISADAIVNAANSSLMGGGGVDGAIHRAGGPEILEECRKIIARQGSCKTGEAVITSAGKLPAKYVIHTVGPVWQDGTHHEQDLLEACYANSLKLAVRYNCNSIAFPAISTGVYRFPVVTAASIAVRTIKEFLAAEKSISRVVMVCYDTANYDAVANQLR